MLVGEQGQEVDEVIPRGDLVEDLSGDGVFILVEGCLADRFALSLASSSVRSRCSDHFSYRHLEKAGCFASQGYCLDEQFKKRRFVFGESGECRVSSDEEVRRISSYRCSGRGVSTESEGLNST